MTTVIYFSWRPSNICHTTYTAEIARVGGHYAVQVIQGD